MDNTNSIVILADGRCKLVIDTVVGPSANANWNVIWQTSEVIVDMYLRQQMSGRSIVPRKSFRRLKEEKKLIFGSLQPTYTFNHPLCLMICPWHYLLQHLRYHPRKLDKSLDYLISVSKPSYGLISTWKNLFVL